MILLSFQSHSNFSTFLLLPKQFWPAMPKTRQIIIDKCKLIKKTLHLVKSVLLIFNKNFTCYPHGL